MGLANTDSVNDMKHMIRLVLIVPVMGCGADAQRGPTASETAMAFDNVDAAGRHRASRTDDASSRHVPEAGLSGARSVVGVDNRCEDFAVFEKRDGRLRHRRNRRAWPRDQQARFSDLVKLVADEMDADARLFQIWSLRESSHRPSAIHVLNPDLMGAAKAWNRHLYRPARALELQAEMDRYGAKTAKYWAARAEIARMNVFRHNRFYLDQLEFDFHTSPGEVQKRKRSQWAYGYGPFGFNPTYYVPVWDSNAPPWVFCDAGGVVAVVTAVWAARSAQRECRVRGKGSSYVVVNRRFSSGHCRPRPKHDAVFARRARAIRLQPDRRARRGKLWPRATTDRVEVVQHMRRRAEAEGLM